MPTVDSYFDTYRLMQSDVGKLLKSCPFKLDFRNVLKITLDIIELAAMEALCAFMPRLQSIEVASLEDVGKNVSIHIDERTEGLKRFHYINSLKNLKHLKIVSYRGDLLQFPFESLETFEIAFEPPYFMFLDGSNLQQLSRGLNLRTLGILPSKTFLHLPSIDFGVFTNLRVLTLSQFNHAHLAVLESAKLVLLEELYLHFEKGESIIPQFLDFNSLPSLKVLEMSREGPLLHVPVDALAGCRRLERFAFHTSRGSFGPYGVSFCTLVTIITVISRLDFFRSSIYLKMFVDRAVTLSDLTTLTSLDLRGSLSSSDCKGLGNLTLLIELKLDGKFIVEELAKAMKKLKHLEVFQLSFTAYFSTMSRTYTQNPFESYIGALSILSALPRSTLRSLTIGEMPLDDKIIGALVNLVNLEHLSVVIQPEQRFLGEWLLAFRKLPVLYQLKFVQRNPNRPKLIDKHKADAMYPVTVSDVEGLFKGAQRLRKLILSQQAVENAHALSQLSRDDAEIIVMSTLVF